MIDALVIVDRVGTIRCHTRGCGKDDDRVVYRKTDDRRIAAITVRFIPIENREEQAPSGRREILRTASGVRPVITERDEKQYPDEGAVSRSRPDCATANRLTDRIGADYLIGRVLPVSTLPRLPLLFESIEGRFDEHSAAPAPVVAVVARSDRLRLLPRPKGLDPLVGFVVVAWCGSVTPALFNAARSSSKVSRNFAVTTVPPLKSTLN